MLNGRIRPPALHRWVCSASHELWLGPNGLKSGQWILALIYFNLWLPSLGLHQPLRPQSQFYKTTIRLILSYGVECWTTEKGEEEEDKKTYSPDVNAKMEVWSNKKVQ